jgi:hypothetical protein
MGVEVVVVISRVNHRPRLGAVALPQCSHHHNPIFRVRIRLGNIVGQNHCPVFNCLL